MAMNQEQEDQEAAEFAAAFESGEPAAPQKTEDEEFGLSPEMPSAEGGDAGSAPAASDMTEDAPHGEMPIGEEPAAEGDPMPEGEPMAEEVAPEAMPEEASEPAAEEASESPEMEASEQPAEGGEDAEVEAAIASLAADFGQEFVDKIKLIATHCACKAGMEAGASSANGLNERIEQIASSVDSARADMHFGSISDKHPDFMEVAQSPDFHAWVAARPPEVQAQIQQILDSGSARSVIGLLDAYKNPPTEEDPAADEWAGAEGVRSSASPQIPDAPETNPDYAEAWDRL